MHPHKLVFVLWVSCSLLMPYQLAHAGNNDRAHGSGRSFINSRFSFSARADGTGLGSIAARGRFSETCLRGCNFTEEFKQRVRVTCINVVGNKASIGGVIISSTAHPEAIGSGFVLVVKHGVGVDAGAETITAGFFPPPGQGDCPTPSVDPAALLTGRIKVVDAP